MFRMKENEIDFQLMKYEQFSIFIKISSELLRYDESLIYSD